jgi:hypothetical protein
MSPSIAHLFAFGMPGPCELAFLVALLLLIPAVVLLLMRGAFHRPQPGGFPVVAKKIESTETDGPGTYRIVGVEKSTRADRDFTVEAASLANARVKAELYGIVVTQVTKVV